MHDHDNHSVVWDQDEDEDEIIYIPPRNDVPPRDRRDLWAQDGEDERSDAFSSGYRRRSEAVWRQARDDYLSGYSAEAVCARYDLKLSTFKGRAKRQGWRRSDQPDPEPRAWDEADAPESGDEAEDIAAADLPDYAAMARAALVRADRAIRGGRDLEAARWLRMHERLSRLITDYNWRLAAWRKEEEAAKGTKSEEDEEAVEPAPAPAPLSAFAALSDQLAALEAALISDDSDDSDSVFPEPDAAPSPDPDKATERPPEPAAPVEAAPISDDSDASDSVFSDAGSGAEPQADTARRLSGEWLGASEEVIAFSPSGGQAASGERPAPDE